MLVRCRVYPSTYHDSVTLMETARALGTLPGVADAAVVMGTPANQSILRQADLLPAEAAAATSNDLLVVVRAESEEAAERALQEAEKRLRRRPSATVGGPSREPRTLRAAIRSQPEADLALISVAGPYAAAEAWEALRAGLHVFLFSDNVPAEDEVALKEYAGAHDLLMMGPGCGTALLNGVGLGFANAVPRGPVGIVAAAGTGLQEVSSMLARLGVGVSQGIGVGGRDLREAVGGLMMRQSVRILQSDPETRLLLLIAKPPAPEVAAQVLALLREGDKPAVVCFLGGDPVTISAAGATPARTLQEAAYLAAEAAGAGGLSAQAAIQQEMADLRALAANLAERLRPGQRFLRGLFSGGTLAAEALVVWQDLGLTVRSNVAADLHLRLADPTRSEGHCAVDLGEAEFTVGRLHPMIDYDLRVRRLLQEAADPEVAVILLDVVLGYGAHPDPAGELGPAIRRAREEAAREGRGLIVVASVTGTEGDPQGLSRQVRSLEEAGAIVCSCNAAAARLAGLIVEMGRRGGGDRGLRVTASPHHSVAASPRHPVSAFPRPHVINIGLRVFAESLRAQGVPVTHVDWQPPLAPRLLFTRAGVDIEAANAEAVSRIQQGRLVLVGMGIARQVIPGFHDRLILHSGPPITWERMCGPQRGAVMGALVYEGLAGSEQEAAELAASGEIEFAPCHHYHAVGPMAGVISPSMPVFIVRNETFGNLAYATQNEGLGRVLRYGAYGPDVYQRLRWMADVLYPTLQAAIAAVEGGIDLRALISQALHMGDECHNRNRAGTSLFLRAITPALMRTCPDRERAAQVFEFISGNDHFFLNLSMAAGKAMVEPAEGIVGATVLTVMARNGTEFGIRMAGEPQRWFTAPAGQVQGLYFPGYTAADANPDIGDSTITETAGFGGFAMAAAPAIARFVGGTPQEALETTLEMYEICFAEHEHFTIPALGFRGTPLGIDVRKVAETGILPRLNTGIAHREPGIGMVGAGVLRAPEACFAQAFAAVREW